MGKLTNNCCVFLTLFVSLAMLLSFCQVSTMACIEEEREALLKLKASFIDPSKRLISWKGLDCCNWGGVGCNETSGHVIKLDLQNWVNFSTSLLTSRVDSSLLELKYLNYLDLSGNYFNYSQIPNFLSLMVELRYLNLSHGWFYGRVPPHIGNLTNLLVLDINNVYSYNGGYMKRTMLFIDNVEWISSLLSLQYLDLSGVNLEEALDLMQVLNTLPSLLSLKLRLCSLQNIHLSYASSNSSFLFRIQLLDMSYNVFNCALPKAFQNMTSLRFLFLSNSHFNSSIPLWFDNLRNLVIVSLESNLFTSIEVGLSSIIRNNCHLKVFNLSDNGFLRGDVFGIHKNLSASCNQYDLEVLDLGNIGFGAYKIPYWLGQLKNLKYLNLKSSSLYGPIPASLGNLSNIESLDVSYNMLTGGIPTSFGKLFNLKRLRLQDNKLDGVIDTSFGQLRSLEKLDIAKNSIKGVISEIHFANLSHLYILNMDGNDLLSLDAKSNWIPPFQLKFISMRSCKGFGTELPLWIQTQKEIVSLDLANTSISGAIPRWLKGENLLALDLSYNQIIGPLPRNTNVQMPNLKILFLSNNHINDSFPRSVCKLKHLMALDLSNNRLFGTIPSCLSTPNLLLLDLSSNEFLGVFPSSLGHLSSLRQLYLGNNKLEGEVPIALRNCRKLVLLDVEGNHFSGNIPTWLGENLENLQILKLRDNMFNGTIPSSLCLLPYLQVLDLACNKLTGNIPPNINNFKTMSRREMMKPQISELCIAIASNAKVCFARNFGQVIKSSDLNYSFSGLNLMVNIDLSNNSLVGTIPSEMVELNFVVGLNLSHNNFSGIIPNDIGRMTSLQSFDLSFNQLSGPLPVSMANLNSLGVLKLSNNNFSGPIPREGHLLTFNDASTYEGNPYLCGDPLLIKCSGDKSFDPPIRTDKFDNHNGQEWSKWEKMWLYIIIMLGYAVGFWGVIGVLMFKRHWRYAYFQSVDNIKDKIHDAILMSMARLKWKMRGNDNMEQ